MARRKPTPTREIRRPPGRAGGAWALVALLAGAPALGAGAVAKPKPLPIEQRRELNTLLATFSRGDDKPADWLRAGERVLQIGPPGPERLLRALTTKLRSARRDYRDTFSARAVRARKDQFAEAATQQGKTPDRLAADVKGLRRTVLALLGAGTTPQKIRTEGDPALARLNALLAVDREAVLRRFSFLQGRRSQLLALTALHRRCESAVAQSRAGSPDAGAVPKLVFDPEQALVEFEQFSAFCALPMDHRSRAAVLANTRGEPKIKPVEAEGIRDLNRIRLLLGLRALQIDLKLCRAARDHSTDMRTRGFFSHVSPVPGKRQPWDRAKRAGTTCHGENIAFGIAGAAAVNRMWFHSPPHLQTMLGAYSRAGLGYDGKWTLMVGR